MTTLSELRATIAETIKGAVSDLRDVDVVQGRVSLEEAHRWLKRVPAARVACLGLSGARDKGDGWWEYTADFAVFVLTRDAGTVEREDMAMGIVEALLKRIPGTTWGTNDVGRAESPQAENLYTTTIGKDGVSLWYVRWTHAIAIQSAGDAPELDDFATAAVAWDLAAVDTVNEAEDTITMETTES